MFFLASRTPVISLHWLLHAVPGPKGSSLPSCQKRHLDSPTPRRSRRGFPQTEGHRTDGQQVTKKNQMKRSHLTTWQIDPRFFSLSTINNKQSIGTMSFWVLWRQATSCAAQIVQLLTEVLSRIFFTTDVVVGFSVVEIKWSTVYRRLWKNMKNIDKYSIWLLGLNDLLLIYMNNILKF